MVDTSYDRCEARVTKASIYTYILGCPKKKEFLKVLWEVSMCHKMIVKK